MCALKEIYASGGQITLLPRPSSYELMSKVYLYLSSSSLENEHIFSFVVYVVGVIFFLSQ